MSKARGKILVVDDEESIRTLISRRLHADGYDCVLAKNGEEALETASAQDFDLVLSDIKMPGISGIEVLSQIVANHPDTGVVMISAVADTQTAVEAMKLGAYDYVTKPFELDALSTRVEKALERKTLIQENRDYKLQLAEQALQESEDRFKHLLETMSEGYFIVQDSVVVYANAACARLLQYTPEEVIGRPVHELLPPEQLRELSRLHRSRLSGDSIPDLWVAELAKKDGSPCTVEFVGSVIDYEGTPAVSFVARDITERKKDEEIIRHKLGFEEVISRISSRFVGTSNVDYALSASLSDISLLSGASHSYLFRFREDGETMDSTHDWCAEGASPQKHALQGLPRHMFPWWLGELRKGEPLHVTDVSELPSPAVAETLKLGGPDVRSIVALPLAISGKPDGFIGLINTTRIGEQGDDDLLLLRIVSEVIGSALERRQAEEELQTYKEHLEELVAQRTAELESSQGQLLQSAKLAAIGELVSGVAHEVNNPLAAISMYSELLMDEIEDGVAKEHLQIVNAQAERAVAIVENLLSFARKHEPKRSYISMNDSITSTVELRAYDLNLDNIQVVLDLDPDLPRTMTDFRQLQQVFLNLITNAEQALKQAHGRGTITIRTQKSDGVIKISVTDDGPGIPADVLSRIFEPFYTTKDVGKGTGLGLSICHGIIQEHGGQIRVESTEGSGATFTVEIPIVTEDASDEDQRCEPTGSTPDPDPAPERPH